MTLPTTQLDVCFFIPSLGMGGVERMISYQQEALQAQGFRALCLVKDPEHPLLAGRSRVATLEPGQKLSDWLKLMNPRVVVTGKVRDGVVLETALNSWHADQRPAHLVRVGTHLGQWLADVPWWHRYWHRRRLRWLLRRCTLISGNSRALLADLRQQFPAVANKTFWLPNPTVHPRLVEQAQEPAGHPWLDEKTEPVALCLGRLARVKANDVVLRALARVNRQRPLRLLFVGDGREREPLVKLAGQLGLTERVGFAGHQHNPYALLARADVFVSASTREGFPNALVEAMALGVTPVVTDCLSGPAEITAAGQCGYLVPVGQTERLAEALLQALDQPVDAERLRGQVAGYTPEQSTLVLVKQLHLRSLL